MKVLNHTLSANTAGQSMIHLVMEGEEPVRNQDALINEFLAKMDDESWTTQQTAEWFLKNKEDVWTKWVSSEVAAKVKAAL